MSRDGSFGPFHVRWPLRPRSVRGRCHIRPVKGPASALRPSTVTAGLFAVAGIAALLLGAFFLRRVGVGYRIGRLVAASPDATLDEAVALARGGEARYVRLHGRISSDEEFPDEQQRPLVYRRRRIQRADGRGGWLDLSDQRLAVPFGIEDRQTFVAIDVEALGDGLVVVPRESVGVASDLPASELPTSVTLDPATAVRLRIDQVSSVEHATVAGVPRLDTDGQPTLSAGLGRPLILSTLDTDATMRILAAGQRGSVLMATALLVGGMACLALAIVTFLLGF